MLLPDSFRNQYRCISYISISIQHIHQHSANTSTDRGLVRHEHRWSAEKVAKRVMQEIEESAGVKIRVTNHLRSEESLPRARTEQRSQHAVVLIHSMGDVSVPRRLQHSVKDTDTITENGRLLCMKTVTIQSETHRQSYRKWATSLHEEGNNVERIP